VRERRGPLGRVGGIVDSVVTGMRRRQQSRQPRVVLYDSAGHARLLPPDTAGHDALLDTAERILEAAGAE
jgi:hypothetical protein